MSHQQLVGGNSAGSLFRYGCEPSSSEGLRYVYGIGDAKMREYGTVILAKIAGYCKARGVAMDQATRPPAPREQPARTAPITGTRAVAYDLFREKSAIEDVMHQTGRTRSTIMDYLADYIRQEKAVDISAWVPKELYDQVSDAARKVGTDRLKPIFIELGEKVPYDVIRLIVAQLAR